MADEQQRSIARDRLQRTVPFTLERSAGGDEGENGDGLTLEGHAAVFNKATLIDSWEGRFWEDIARGAFKKTFAERTPVLQFDHGHHPLVGSIPIGRIKVAKEDQQGAYTKARLHDNWLVQPVRDAIESESINGMSFRFTVVREEWRDPDGNLITDMADVMKRLWNWEAADDELLRRTLRELKVPELGPVVFPAYAETDVGVRSGRTVIDLGQLRESPDARKQLARTLWVAEQGASQHGDKQADTGANHHRQDTASTPETRASGNTYAVGDRVQVTIDPPHEEGQTTGTVAEVGGTAYGIVFDSMPDMGVHRWYTAAEVEPVEPAGRSNPPLSITLVIDGQRSAEEIAEETRAVIERVYGARARNTVHTDDTNHGSAAGNGTDTDTGQPDAESAHRSDTAPAGDGHAGTAPASERHASEEDEPPGGHSSEAPAWATVPNARRVRLAEVLDKYAHAREAQAIHERSVLAYEAELTAQKD